MPKASDLKRGMVVDIGGTPHAVKGVEAKSPSSRGASTLYKIRFTNLLTGQKLDESLKGDDLLKEMECQRVQVQFSYRDGDAYYFMDSVDYTQYALDSDALTGQVEYLDDALEGIVGLVMDGVMLGIELPQSVSLKIVDTVPGIKGSSATGRTKPAQLSSGLEIQVPEYLEPGTVIKVNTVSGKFISRA